MMHLSMSELQGYVAHAPAIPKDRDRAEVRLYATIITASAAWSLLQPAIYLLQGENTPLLKVASVLGYPKLLAALFIFASALLMPHMMSLLAIPKMLACKLPRKMATLAMVLAGVLWGLLATTAHPLDLGAIALTYWASAAGYMLVGGAYGYSLNAQQAIEKASNEAKPEAS